MSLEEYIKFSRSGKEGKSILTLRIPENKTAGNPSEWLVSYFSNIEALPENVSTAGQWFVLWSPLPCCCTTANCLKAGIISLWSVITQLPTQYLNIVGTQNAWGACQFSSVTQSCLTLCDPMNSSTPGLPCPPPTPGVYPNSCPLSRWCHPAISSSVVPFSCPQSFPACACVQKGLI